MQEIDKCETFAVYGSYGEWFYDWMEIWVASLYDTAYYHSQHYSDDDDEYYQTHYHGMVWSG